MPPSNFSDPACPDRSSGKATRQDGRMQERPKDRETAPGRTARLCWLVPSFRGWSLGERGPETRSRSNRGVSAGRAGVGAEAIGEGEGRQGGEWWTILDL